MTTNTTEEEQHMSDQTEGTSPTPVPAPEASKDPNRPYTIFTKLDFDLTSDAGIATAIESLKAVVDKDGKIAVLATVGKVLGDAPKKAIQNLGEIKDLDGDYTVIADNSFNPFSGVKSKTKRSVTFG